MARTAKPRRPLSRPPKGVRQRQRSDGTWRVWWEPDATARANGMRAEDLNATDPGWSERRAAALNAQADKAADPRAAARPQGRTISDLIENYRLSLDWRDLKPATQRSYNAVLSQIERKWGSELVIEFTRPVMATWYEAVAKTGKLRMAQSLIRMASILFNRAELIGWRPEGQNPCAKLKLRTPEPRARRADWADLDALVTTADRLGLPGIGTAVLLLTLMGQRSTDVRQARLCDFQLVALARGQAPVWVWRLTRQKRGTEGALILHPEVEARLRPLLLRDAERADAPACPRPDTGAAYDPDTPDLMIKHFNRVRDSAGREGLAGLQMRDLRRTFGILARTAGATREDVADALGNTAAKDSRLYETYMPATVHSASRAVQIIKRPGKEDEG